MFKHVDERIDLFVVVVTRVNKLKHILLDLFGECHNALFGVFDVLYDCSYLGIVAVLFEDFLARKCKCVRHNV